MDPGTESGFLTSISGYMGPNLWGLVLGWYGWAENTPPHTPTSLADQIKWHPAEESWGETQTLLLAEPSRPTIPRLCGQAVCSVGPACMPSMHHHHPNSTRLFDHHSTSLLNKSPTHRCMQACPVPTWFSPCSNSNDATKTSGCGALGYGHRPLRHSYQRGALEVQLFLFVVHGR